MRRRLVIFRKLNDAEIEAIRIFCKADSDIKMNVDECFTAVYGKPRAIAPIADMYAEKIKYSKIIIGKKENRLVLSWLPARKVMYFNRPLNQQEGSI
ncbi:MAG: hypothetical protein J6P16_01665 [Eubacterium sp.]|nr:hypothetical protein [Eubacterium sp.]